MSGEVFHGTSRPIDVTLRLSRNGSGSGHALSGGPQTTHSGTERMIEPLDQPYPRRFQPFSTLDDVDDDGLPFGEVREPGSFESGDVDEHVLPATIAGDEAETLLGVEPFHSAGLLDGYARR